MCSNNHEQLGTFKSYMSGDGWIGLDGSQTICTARAPLSDANKIECKEEFISEPIVKVLEERFYDNCAVAGVMVTLTY